MIPRRYLLNGLFGAAAIITPVIVIAIVAWMSMDTVTTEFRNRAERTLDLMDAHARRGFGSQQSTMAAIQDRIAGMDWAQIAQSEDTWRFLRTVTVGSVSTGFALAGPDGRIVSTARSAVFPSPRVDISTRDYVRSIWAGNRGLSIGQVIDASLVGFTHFPMGIARLGADGQPDRGIIVSGFSPDFFGEYYTRFLEHPSEDALLLRADGKVLACQPAARACQGLSDGSDITGLLGTGTNAFAGLTRPDGTQRVYGVRRVAGFDVAIAFGTDREALSDRRFQRTLSIGLPLVLITEAILLCAFFLTRQFLRR